MTGLSVFNVAMWSRAKGAQKAKAFVEGSVAHLAISWIADAWKCYDG